MSLNFNFINLLTTDFTPQPYCSHPVPQYVPRTSNGCFNTDLAREDLSLRSLTVVSRVSFNAGANAQSCQRLPGAPPAPSSTPACAPSTPRRWHSGAFARSRRRSRLRLEHGRRRRLLCLGSCLCLLVVADDGAQAVVGDEGLGLERCARLGRRVVVLEPLCDGLALVGEAVRLPDERKRDEWRV